MSGLRMRVVKCSLIACVIVASGCSTTFEPPTVDYKSDQPRKTPLDVPPDLSQLQRDDRFVVPGSDGKSSATASSAQPGVAQVQVNAVAPAPSGVVLQREGNQRWLEVNQTPDQLWPVVHQFWIDNGFTYQLDDQNVGVLETNWAENRATLPQGLVRRTFGFLFDQVSDSGKRDRYRTRLTRTSNGTEITITHRGIEETLNSTKDTSTWQPRQADPELEAEFLQRLMVKLGVEASKARGDATASTAGVRSAPAVLRATSVTLPEGGRAIDLDDTADRAWRRVGLALDRIGFTVENRDRSTGFYVVRYIDPDRDAAERGFFARLFNMTPDAKPQQVKVYVKPEGALQRVTVLPGDPAATGAKSPSASETKDAIDRITTQLFDELK